MDEGLLAGVTRGSPGGGRVDAVLRHFSAVAAVLGSLALLGLLIAEVLAEPPGRPEALGSSTSGDVDLASQHVARVFCAGEGGRLESQQPFYLQFLASCSMVALNHRFFPSSGLDQPAKPHEIAVASMLGVTAFLRAYTDIIDGTVLFCEAWGLCLVTGSLLYLLGRSMTRSAARAFDDATKQVGAQFATQAVSQPRGASVFGCISAILAECAAACCAAVISFLVGAVIYGITVLVLVAGIVVVSTLIFLVSNVALGVYAPALLQDYNCSSLRWTRGASQLPNILQMMVILPNVTHYHWLRGVVSAPFIVTSILYAPPVLLAFVTHVMPGAVVYPPLTLLLVVAMAAMLVVASRLGLDGGEALELPSYDERSRRVKFQLQSKLALVPLVLFCQFVGEAMVRLMRGQGWWPSLYTTWAERTLGAYTAYIRTGALHGLSAIASFL